MGSNFSMITKSGGTVTAKNDGAVFAAALPDCRLAGCAFSISGTTLTVAAGAIVIAGREFYASSASTFTVPSTGWLVATVTDSAISFGTATTTPALQQDDINVAGTKYMVIVCQTADGAIVSELPRYCKNGGILYGTASEPPAGSYADGTLYVQYEA